MPDASVCLEAMALAREVPMDDLAALLRRLRALAEQTCEAAGPACGPQCLACEPVRSLPTTPADEAPRRPSGAVVHPWPAALKTGPEFPLASARWAPLRAIRRG